MVLVLKHGSRNMEGVYLKSPEIKNVSMLTVNSHDSVINMLEATHQVFCPCIQTLTSVQYRAKVAFEEKHDSPRTVVGVYQCDC